MTKAGKIRIVSKRVRGILPFFGEWVVDVDRTCKVFGNPVLLKSYKSDIEREAVIAQYAEILESDIALKGPIYAALQELAQPVSQGKNLALRCWCAPLRCHGELLAAKIAEYSGGEVMLAKRPEKPVKREKVKEVQMDLFAQI